MNRHVSPVIVEPMRGKREIAVIFGRGYLDNGWK